MNYKEEIEWHKIYACDKKNVEFPYSNDTDILILTRNHKVIKEKLKNVETAIAWSYLPKGEML